MEVGRFPKRGEIYLVNLDPTRRLIKLLGKISEKELKEIEKALLIHLGINL